MLGTREPADIREHGHRSERDDRTHAQNGLKPLEVGGEGLPLFRESRFEDSNLTADDTPHRAVALDVRWISVNKIIEGTAEDIEHGS